MGVVSIMVASVQTVAYLGLEARGVEVQCQVAPGLPRFAIVGLPDKAVGECRIYFYKQIAERHQVARLSVYRISR